MDGNSVSLVLREVSLAGPAQSRNCSSCGHKDSETLDLLSEIMIRVTNVSFSRESAREAVDCLREGPHDCNNRSGRR